MPFVRNALEAPSAAHGWAGSSNTAATMDRAFANTVILAALRRDPERVCEVIADVARSMEAKGHPAEEIDAAVAELLDELMGRDQPRH